MPTCCCRAADHCHQCLYISRWGLVGNGYYNNCCYWSNSSNLFSTSCALQFLQAGAGQKGRRNYSAFSSLYSSWYVIKEFFEGRRACGLKHYCCIGTGLSHPLHLLDSLPVEFRREISQRVYLDLWVLPNTSLIHHVVQHYFLFSFPIPNYYSSRVRID